MIIPLPRVFLHDPHSVALRFSNGGVRIAEATEEGRDLLKRGIRFVCPHYQGMAHLNGWDKHCPLCAAEKCRL